MRLLLIQTKTSKRLMEVADGESSVRDIAERTKIHYVIVCTMLNKLRKHNILTSKRKGKEVYYSVNGREINRIMDICVKLNGYA